jgi:hypothetical protein
MKQVTFLGTRQGRCAGRSLTSGFRGLSPLRCVKRGARQLSFVGLLFPARGFHGALGVLRWAGQRCSESSLQPFRFCFLISYRRDVSASQWTRLRSCTSFLISLVDGHGGIRKCVQACKSAW